MVPIMLAYFGVSFGILLLIGGGTALVAGASQVAERLGVSPLIIGLTIVGFGTSAPELVVNVDGALRGETALAFGNVIGSNIANLALVLGAASLLRPIEIRGNLVRHEIPLLLLVTSVIAIMALDGVLEGTVSRIGRSDSMVLLLLFGIFVYISIQDLLPSRRKDTLLTEIQEHSAIVPGIPLHDGRKTGILLISGFVLLYLGGEMTVRSSVALSEQLGISTALVGLFIVAVGTSMPELVTSIIAARRNESDLAIGNVIGSNIFNSLIVLPASGLVSTIPVPDGGLLDLGLSWVLTVALIPIFILGRARLGRGTGLTLLVIYFAYAAYRVSGA
ncbi:MAG: calcium/sodium antiporter [Xanthomonadales bacterium]|nr:calcium/sodium antiporter [Xanthomonadales bacterium]